MAEELIAGRYRLLEPLGRGAMSAVWAAHDDELDRRVAVKMLAPSADRERFVREARAAAALSHPNIVGVYDYGESESRPFMVLEYLEGGSLEDRLQDGRPLPDEETRRIATDVAAGLAHAHERGLVHRDLKPANILFDSEGRARIADFGIARMRGTGTLTDAGTVLGTASYISPEQAAGEPAGPPSDVYSLAVVCFRMLTGRLPFTGTNAMEIVRLHRDAAPPDIADLRPDAPDDLRTLVTASLAKDPSARPADGAAVLTLLRGGEHRPLVPVSAVADTAATQILPRARRRSRGPLVAALVIAAGLVAGGAVLAVLLTGGGNGPGAPPSLSLPTVSTAPGSTEPTTAPTTATEPGTSTQATTTAPATTVPATTTPTTTAATTATAPATTVVPPTTTTVAPPTTTAPVTTDTTPTTTAGTTTTAP